MKSTDESDVGIFCFASPFPGFKAVIKQRYSDFIVNEVDSDGVVVRLSCCDAPPEETDASTDVAKKPREGIDEHDASGADYATEIELFGKFVGEDDVNLLKGLLEQISSDPSTNLSPILLSPDPDKSHRAEVHNFFKVNFKFLITDTVDGPDSSTKRVRVRHQFAKMQGNGRSAKRRKFSRDKRVEGDERQPFDSRGANTTWPEDIGKFLCFHLYKENKGTQDALAIIGKMLGIQQKSFGFAGTKDKRAITTQKVTVFKQQAKRLAALNERLIDIRVGDFRYIKEGLLLGQLSGNRFVVTLRAVESESHSVIRTAAEGLGSHGFINYFGLQRFGSGSIPTHVIGAALLRGEWKTAVDLILDPQEGERNAVADARQYFKETGDVEGTLRKLPRHLAAERAILQGLSKCPGNYSQSLKAIPRTLRMMYVHSYQSYLWNHAASARVQKFGLLKAVVGDLAYRSAGSVEKSIDGSHGDCIDESTLDESGFCSMDDMLPSELPDVKMEDVKVLNDEDVKSGDYVIEDVVLPLPGSRVFYPSNDVASIYYDLAKKDGISLTESLHNVKEFSITNLTGAYRRVLQRPTDYEWELLKYSDPNIPLVETDLDVMLKSRTTNKENETGSLNGDGSGDDMNGTHLPDHEVKCPAIKEKTESLDKQPQTALKLCLTLPASCYATMAIRELLKTSTSVSFQKSLNENA